MRGGVHIGRDQGCGETGGSDLLVCHGERVERGGDDVSVRGVKVRLVSSADAWEVREDDTGDDLGVRHQPKAIRRGRHACRRVHHRRLYDFRALRRRHEQTRVIWWRYVLVRRRVDVGISRIRWIHVDFSRQALQGIPYGNIQSNGLGQLVQRGDFVVLAPE